MNKVRLLYFIIVLFVSGCNEAVDIFDAAAFDATTLKKAIDSGIDINVQNEDGDTPLILACSYGNLNNIKLLLSHGANVNHKNNDGDTAISQVGSLGILENAPEIIRLLVKRGANINARNNFGDTALHTSILSAKPIIAKALLKNGANPNLKNNAGDSPIMSICIIDIPKAKKIIDLLLQYGVDINTKDSESNTLSSSEYLCTQRKQLMSYLKAKGLK